MRLPAAKLKIVFRTNDKVGQRLMEVIQAGKVDVAAIHHNKASGFGNDTIQHMRIAGMSACDVDQHGNSALHVSNVFSFTAALERSMRRPGKQRQAQIDDRRIQGIERAVQIQTQIHVPIKWPCLLNQMLSKIRIDSPVSSFIGIGKSRPFYRRSKSGVIELPAMCGETDFDVAETFTMSQLSKSHRQELFPTGQIPNTPIAVVAMHESIEIVMRNKLKQLSENGLSTVHRRPPAA